MNPPENKKDYAEYREFNLQKGIEFQDYISSRFLSLGIVLVGFASRKYQIVHGENALGAEIKRDDNFRKTGNLYIEFKEKAFPRPGDYAESGILRKDNSWLFVIGDEGKVWIFGTDSLSRICEHYKCKKVENGSKTSLGYLLPLHLANQFSLKIIEFTPS